MLTTAEVTANRSASLEDLTRLGDALLELDPHELRQFLASLTPAQLRATEYALGCAGAGHRADPVRMWVMLSGGLYRGRAYLRVLSHAFRRLADGVEPRQRWELPSRYGKSELVRRGIAWLLDRDTAANVILNSYAHELAMESAVAVRDLILTYPDVLRVRLRPDKRRKDRWSTSAGGGLLAAGRGGSVVGFGAGGGNVGAGGGLVLDDMLKNWTEAHSAVTREQLWNHYRAVLRLRLNDDRAFILAVGTRWHPDDLHGKLDQAAKAGDGEVFSVYRLPALAEAPSVEFPEPDLLGRAPGEPLDPDVFPLADVLARHKTLGSYLTAGLEQQRPAPEEGGELKRAWWKWGTPPTSAPDQALTSWDMKLKDTTSGDYVVGQAWHRYGSTAWCLEQLRGQWGFVTTRAAIALMQVRHPKITLHLIENTGNGPEVMRDLRRGISRATVDDATAGALGMNRSEREQVELLLRRGMGGLVAVTPADSKVVRARRCAPFLEAGDVWLPETAANGWGLQLVNESAAFPDPSGHDDQVDAFSQAVDRLLGTSAASTQAPPPGSRAQPPRAQHGVKVQPAAGARPQRPRAPRR